MSPANLAPRDIPLEAFERMPGTLQSLLAAYLPPDTRDPCAQQEHEDLARMRRFAVELASPFSRSQPFAHFTGSAVVVDGAGARVCLVHHRKLGRWLQPGGHSEPQDAGDLHATALREAREETGLEVRPHPSAPHPLDVDAHRIPARPDAPEHWHLDVRFLLVADHPAALAPDSVETRGARFFTFDEALALADEPALRRVLSKARAAGPA